MSKKWNRNACNHADCFYCPDNKGKPELGYCTVLKFEKNVKEIVEKMNRVDIQKSFVHELQIMVNDCEAIDSTFSKEVLYFTCNVRDNESLTKIKICEQCKVSLYQTEKHNYYPSFRTFARWKADAKCLKLDKASMLFFNAKLDKKEMKGILKETKFKNLNAAKQYYKRKGSFMPSEDAMRLQCLPDKPKHREALVWMKNFFDMECQYPPNKKNICELPTALYSKSMVHRLFVKSCQLQYTGEEHPYCNLAEFLFIWRNCYANVKIHKYLAVSGKCDTCLNFHTAMLSCQTIDEFEDLEYFKILHRLEVSMCKMAYYENRLKAYNEPDRVCVIITDGWAVKRTTLPYLANQKEYGEEVHQHCQGCKQFKLRRAIHRTFPHVKTGTNLNMTCIVNEILDRVAHCEEFNLPFPTDLLLQVDGGPENTSKAFLAFGELLVRLNIFEHLEINRLPVGHTHEDIDAMFGNLWNFLKPWPIYTPQRFQELVEKAFQDGQFIDTRKTDKKKKKD